MNNLVRFYRGLVAPASPEVGMLWFDLSTFTIKLYNGGQEGNGWETYGTDPADIQDLIARIVSLETSVLGITNEIIPAIEQALADEIARATEAETKNAEAIKEVKDRLDFFLDSTEIDMSVIDTLKEIQQYVQEHGKEVVEMLQTIQQNTDAIAALDGEVDALTDTVRENELVTAAALNDLAARMYRTESTMISSIVEGDYISVTPGTNSATVSVVTGSVADGEDGLAVASDVKQYVADMMSWADGSFETVG